MNTPPVQDPPLDPLTVLDRGALGWWCLATGVMVTLAWIVAMPHNALVVVLGIGYVIWTLITWLFVLPNRSVVP